MAPVRLPRHLDGGDVDERRRQRGAPLRGSVAKMRSRRLGGAAGRMTRQAATESPTGAGGGRGAFPIGGWGLRRLLRGHRGGPRRAIVRSR